MPHNTHKPRTTKDQQPPIDVTIVGSGFAGSILACLLARQGLTVRLVERGSHPRFSLGESSTPLAAVALERMAERYGLDALANLGHYSRFVEHHPQLGHGLKRGFTFLRHHPGQEAQPSQRLLVAASPVDAVADLHWRRSEVDQWLFELAREQGVETLELVELDQLSETPDWLEVSGVQNSPQGPSTQRIRFRTRFLIDGSGPMGFVPTTLQLQPAEEIALSTSLVFAHFNHVEPLSQGAQRDGWPQGPYPDEAAAVHHLLDEGWLYSLRFSDGTVSAGLVLDQAGGKPVWQDPTQQQTAEDSWQRTIARYPTLARCFGEAQATRPLQAIPRLQHRLQSCAGKRWALLPHSFCFRGPMFSTGIAWSLAAVERLAEVLPEAQDEEAPFGRYAQLLQHEADQLDRLWLSAHRTKTLYSAFRLVAFAYFATVSFEESLQRLLPETLDSAAAWRGFLGAGDAHAENTFRELERLTRGDLTPTKLRRLQQFTASALAPRDIMGLQVERSGGRDGGEASESAGGDLVPVDLKTLLERAPLLGVSRQQLEAALPRLRLPPEALPGA